MLESLRNEEILVLDTETTGLMWHQGAKPFAIIIAGLRTDPIYLNLWHYNGTEETVPSEVLQELEQILNRAKRVIIHNAKFDLHMLENIGIRITEPEIYDAMVMHRFLNNKLMSYSLANLTGEKSDAVKEWIKKNPKIGKVRDKFGDLQPAYWKVPFDLMREYAIQDVIALRNLYLWQQEQMDELWNGEPPMAFAIEMRATKTIYRAERRGIMVDTEYILASREHEDRKIAAGRAEFQRIAGEEFVNSGKALGKIFERFGHILPKTDKGNTQVDEETLAKIDHPISKVILEIRKAEKRKSTYLDNFLHLRNPTTGAIHTDFRQSGADTMRMSASAPNAQNVPDESEENPQPEFILRGCFIPRPDFSLVSIDFAAQEMRVAIDAAGEGELAQKVIGGMDVHDATASMMGVGRKAAKNIGFGLIYGSGPAKMAEQIGCSVQEASRLRQLYFSRLRGVQSLSRALTRMADENGYIVTRYGNRLFIDEGFGYKGMNYFVQGTCAQHTKAAAVNVDMLLEPHKSKLLLLIHDELLLEMHKSEMHLIPEIRKLMECAYPHSILPMGTSVEIYKHRWGGESEEIK